MHIGTDELTRRSLVRILEDLLFYKVEAYSIIRDNRIDEISDGIDEVQPIEKEGHALIATSHRSARTFKAVPTGLTVCVVKG
jgi:hypothetical protein